MGGQLPPGALDGMDLSELARQANLPSDPNQLRAAAAQMQHLFSGAGGEGPVNWTLGEDLARRTAVGAMTLPGAEAPTGTPGDPGPTDQDVTRMREAAHVAALWLDPVLAIDVPSAPIEVWGRGTWVQRTLPRWRSIVEPVAAHMAGAIGDAIAARLGQEGSLPPGMPGDPTAMMERMGGTLFGVQFGHAIGSLARECTGTVDLGLPLAPDGVAALVPANVEDLLREHSLDPAAGRIFLAARELAHAALFTAAPWLPRQLLGAVEDYARGITLDLDALDDMVQGLDLSDPEAMGRASTTEPMFVFTRRPSQERALEELATTLALVEGWVDHVVTQALEGKLPALDAMREVIRRRRVSGSPAEQMLAQVVGIELRARRAREALAWWESVTATEGTAGREKHWEHPDLLPGTDVLSGEPQAPAAAGEDAEEVAEELPADFDEELRRLLDGEDPRGGEDHGDDPREGGPTDGDSPRA
ncbi:zinc-dependent metalloprotease [Brachybacterium sp. EF45031]|nr:zinc-dependent metalloprotease [Brachybacterium sillae]